MALNVEGFMATLPVMGLGMVGIFVVMAAIALCIMVMNKMFK